MEIRGPRNIDAATLKRAGKTASTGGGFTLSETGGTARGQVVSGPGPIAAVDNILMLQGVDDSASGRSKGLAHGEQLLEMLDEVRYGLLSGGIARSTLNKLAHAVSKRQDGFADPKLQVVLDEIELRARVELAKLEQAEKQYS